METDVIPSLPIDVIGATGATFFIPRVSNSGA